MATAKLMGPPSKSLFKMVPRRMILGTDDMRDVYVAYKRQWNRAALERRERMAYECQQNLDFAIPHDLGVKTLPPGTLPEADEVSRVSADIIANASPEQLIGKRKAQLVQGFVDTAQLELDSPFLRFGLHPNVLGAISAYLGAVPVLAQVDVWYSIHRAGQFENSQLFHCDWTATSQVKVFVFGNDIADVSGPMVLLGAGTSKELRDKLNYNFDDGYRVEDETVEQLVGNKDQHALVGPAGTVAFADTSRCFHYGSRVKEGAQPRIMAFFQYLLPTAFAFPKNYAQQLPFRRFLKDENLSPLQRMALGESA
jgi:hypothetical protein